MSKLKGKRLKAMLEKGWIAVKENPSPTNAQIAAAVEEHNKGYAGVPGQARTQIDDRSWWGSRQGDNGHRRSAYVPVKAITAPAKPNDKWTCPVSDVSGCPIAKEPIVEVPIEMWRVWIDLAEEFQMEWMAYLIGTFDAATGRGQITEMYFPPQSASGAHVEQLDEGGYRPRPGTIAAVHSHVKMQAFFSDTDKKHANWPIEIVVNARGESKMAMRIKLECGRYSRVEGKVMLVGIRASDAFATQLKDAMRKPELPPVTQSSQPEQGAMEGWEKDERGTWYYVGYGAGYLG